MLTTRVIACLDVRDGRVVKGVQFSNLRDSGDPVECAVRYEAEGADEIVMLDVSATPEGRGCARDTVAAIRSQLRIPLTVGGGVRSVDDATRLLNAGADKVGVNTAAVQDPSLLRRLAERFGSQCIVLAIDAGRRAEGGWQVLTRSGREQTGIGAVDWARQGSALGAGEILLTSWDRDGTGKGYDRALIRAVSQSIRRPVIASGGARNADHMASAFSAGASAVLAASIFHDGITTVRQIKQQLAEAGIEVRP